MKKIFYVLQVVLVASFVTSCRKDEPNDVSFDVRTDNIEINANDSVTFHLTGYADVISFYSGEPGKEYVNRNRVEAEGLKLQLTVASRVLYGSQSNNLKLMYSTTFPGKYTAEGMNDEDWTDISGDFTWSTAGANAVAPTTTTSGPVDITKYLEPGKPIYFGYRYESWEATSAALAGRSWRLPTFLLETVAPDGGKSTLATVRTAGWTIVPVVSGVNKVSYWTISASDPYLYFTPNSTLEPHLHWVVTAPFLPTTVNPDKSTPVKALIDKMQDYKYAFSQPGTYKVTFVAKNVNGYGEKEVVKELEITVK